jgi:hypothetical protein
VTRLDAAIKENRNPLLRQNPYEGEMIARSMGIDPQWGIRVLRAVGNYGEVYERNVGRDSPLKIERGLNRLWTHGGLHYFSTDRLSDVRMTDFQINLTIAVFAAVILCIAFDLVDMVVAALLGVSTLIVFGILEGSDLMPIVHTAGGPLSLLFGGMVVARVIGQTGIFERIGDLFLRATGGSGRRLLLLIVVLVAPLCAVLPNATAVILVAPIIVSVCRALKVDIVGPPYHHGHRQ